MEMTEKVLTKEILTKDIGCELLKLMAYLALQMPIGINYELWKELHQIKGDWK